MSEFKTIELKIKKFLINNPLSYYFYKIFKLIKNKEKGNYFGEFGEDILINRFFRKKMMVFMLILDVIIQPKVH